MQTQTLSLKRTLKGITIVGYLGANGKVYKHKANSLRANIKTELAAHKKQVEADVCNMLKAISLQKRLADAQQQLKKHYSFAGYCLVCTCRRLLKAFKLTLDKLAKAMLF